MDSVAWMLIHKTQWNEDTEHGIKKLQNKEQDEHQGDHVKVSFKLL